MTLPTLFLIFFSLFFLFSLSISLWAARKKEQDAYLLADKKLGGFSLGFSIMATQIGGGLVLGTSNAAFQSGWIVYLWPLGYAVGLFAMAMGIGKRMKRLEISTVSEIFEKVYQSTSLRKLAAFFSLFSLFLIIVGQMIAARALFFSLGFNTHILFAALWLAVIVYTMLGGLKTVVYTETLQAICILLLLGIGFFSLLYTTPASTLVSPIESSFKPTFASFFLMPFLFMLIGQDMGQRCFAAKSEKTVQRAFILGGVGLLVAGALPIAMGVMARGLEMEVAPAGSVLIALMQLYSSPLMVALMGCCVLFALISTVDSLLCAISSHVALDFHAKMLSSPWILRLSTLLIGILALALSFLYKDVSCFLMLSYELTVSLLSIPVLMALVFKRKSTSAAYLSFLGGATGFFLFRLMPPPFDREIATLLLSSICYLAGYIRSGIKLRENT